MAFSFFYTPGNLNRPLAGQVLELQSVQLFVRNAGAAEKLGSLCSRHHLDVYFKVNTCII